MIFYFGAAKTIFSFEEKMSRILLKFIIVIIIIIEPALGQSPEDMNNVFQSNAVSYDVPIDILKSIAYTETRLSHVIPHDDYESCTGVPHSFGMMGLRDDNWFGHSLLDAANLIGAKPEMLIYNYELNIQGAAALLSKHAAEMNISRNNLNDWKPVLEKYSGIPQEDVKEFYSFDVMKVLSEGTITNGIKINSHNEIEMNQFSTKVNPINKLINIKSDYYPPAVLDPSPNFYTNPPFYQQFSVVHTTQGSFAASVSWLKNPAASAATHYIIRSSDGYIVQLVREMYAAWHAVCWNRWMFGTEHEGFVDNPAWYTDTMYVNSTALFRHLCVQYNIPMTRSYIIGHGEKSNPTWVAWLQQNFPSIDPNCNSHTDPGQYWDWNFYLQLITQDTLSPKVLSYIPTGIDSIWSNTKIKITFDQRMKTETQNAFSIQYRFKVLSAGKI
jgi:N-acetyl-anhydromuramyl-L-alanine amidase AmpD